jgi:hypothetical protein
MSAFTILAALIALLVLGWAVWFIVGLLRYVLSGDYDVDKRLENISR